MRKQKHVTCRKPIDHKEKRYSKAETLSLKARKNNPVV